MTRIINLSAGAYELADLLALVRQGDDLILEENNKTVARLAPIRSEAPPPPRKPLVLGAFAGSIWMSDDFDDELPMEFWLGDDA